MNTDIQLETWIHELSSLGQSNRIDEHNIYIAPGCG